MLGVLRALKSWEGVGRGGREGSLGIDDRLMLETLKILLSDSES